MIRHLKTPKIAEFFLKMLSFHQQIWVLPTSSYRFVCGLKAVKNCSGVYYRSTKQCFNVRVRSAQPIQSPADIIPQSKSGRVVYLAFSTYKSSQNLYFVEKNSLQNRQSCACFQLGIKICLSTPRTLVLKSDGELFWFPENKATSRYFACSLKEITVL